MSKISLSLNFSTTDLLTTGSKLFSHSLSGFKHYTYEAVEHLVLIFLFYLLVCVLMYLGIVRWHYIPFEKKLPRSKRALIVIAHPDDECMFFGPTITNLVKDPNCVVYLMCLSTGINYGMGKTRKNELYKSCEVLGIDPSCIIIQNHTLLPDSTDANWPIELVAHMVLHQVEIYSIDTLITFDKHGVSDHVNHCSIYYAIAHLAINKELPENCKVYVLESVNKIRKYILLLDIPVSFILSRIRYILDTPEKNKLLEAMKRHESQFVWFRQIYFYFARYVVVNTLQEMNILDIELDLDVDD